MLERKEDAMEFAFFKLVKGVGRRGGGRSEVGEGYHKT
jgi:hypothetical protein